MSLSTTAPPSVTARVRVFVLDELPSLRLDRDRLESLLEDGGVAPIASRKAMVVIARVCRELGVSKVARKADLRSEQVTSLANLIELIATRAVPKLGSL